MRLVELDPMLGPVLVAHRGSSNRQVVLAVLVRGLSAGYSPGLLRRWLISRGDPSLAAFCSSSAWRSLRRASGAHLRRRNGDGGCGGARALRYARNAVASVLGPAPVREGVAARSWSLARQAHMIVMADLMAVSAEKGFDSVYVSTPRLAVELGVTESTAQRALRLCVEAGWLRRMTLATKGKAARYKARVRFSQETIDWLEDEHWPLVNAVAGVPGAEHPAVAVLLAAGHPAITYDLGREVWLTALATAVGVDPATLGIGAKRVEAYRAKWAEVVPDGTTVADALDAWAARTGARRRYAEADHARREETAKRLESLKASRERKSWAYSWLERALEDVPMPSMPTRPVDPSLILAWQQESLRLAQGWAGQMQEYLQLAAKEEPGGIALEERKDLAKAMASKMAARRVAGSEVALDIARAICQVPAPASAA